jgi:hypothetical protein
VQKNYLKDLGCLASKLGNISYRKVEGRGKRRRRRRAGRKVSEKNCADALSGDNVLMPNRQGAGL